MTAPQPQPQAESKPKRRFVGRSTPNGSSTKPAAAAATAPPVVNQIPESILHDTTLNLAISSLLPSNYSFEVHKTIWQIRKYEVQRVALQLPEGLAMWACALVDLVEQFTSAEAVVLGDVTYGACCVDDFTARALGCDMLVHYGHSCLVPIDSTSIRTLYVFVEISVDRTHLAQTVMHNFPHCCDTYDQQSLPAASQPSVSVGTEFAQSQSEEPKTPFKLACVGTVQFLSAVQGLSGDLQSLHAAQSTQLALPCTSTSSSSRGRRPIDVYVPQVKPLSPGEVLGCTAPRLPSDIEAILYVGDGRFHLESIMLANPSVPAFRYDPYEKRLTAEGYEHAEMRQMRDEAVLAGQKSLSAKGNWGIVLGTLGRQGSLTVLKNVMKHVPQGNAVPIALSELSPAKLSLLAPHIDTFVQTSCPRLSIDWGYAFPRPLLTTYEANVSFGRASQWSQHGPYAMDYWADESLGDWTPRYEVGVKAREMKRAREERSKARAEAKARDAAAAAAAAT